MIEKHANQIMELLDHSVIITGSEVEIKNPERLKEVIHHLAEISAIGTGPQQGLARYFTRLIALKSGIYPASIHELYIARGNGLVPNTFTVPAINLRALSFDAARAVFRSALRIEAGAIIFEIARSEMGYTNQPPAEYSTSILAAAIAESYSGPVFIQGDHFQVSAGRYNAAPVSEVQAVKDLINDAIAAGFYNIDVDTSTLVDLSRPTVTEQQTLNVELSAMFTNFIRDHQPNGVMVSVGGEIGEVGGQNSTPEELRAYMDGFNAKLAALGENLVGLSKISIQTGTSHGGVVLPDGSIAQVSVDFDTMLELSRIARNDYGMAGAVQHGASTLPEDAFHKFVEAEACEVHLATNFQNILFDHMSDELRTEMYDYLSANHSNERKPGMTDEQFYYKTRKRAIGPFKSKTWNMEPYDKELITEAWESQFSKLFNLLGIAGTAEYVKKTITPAYIQPDQDYYLDTEVVDEDISDLAD